jgi:NAD(P)-dependent dehydrogenase (short-subunit alcohol dehydrogenase family)
MSSDTIYLVSGANRASGIGEQSEFTVPSGDNSNNFLQGYGLVREIVTKHKNAVVFAGARNPESATVLHDLAKKYPGRVHVVKLVSADLEGNKAVAQEIKEKYGRIDVVIANAGLSSAVTFLYYRADERNRCTNIHRFGARDATERNVDQLRCESNVEIGETLLMLTFRLTSTAPWLSIKRHMNF